MPIDASVFDKIKNYSDYAQADQDFQMRKLAAAQALQTGDIDQNAKKLSLLGQVVGNTSVDQSTYDKARAYAQSLGIDTSGLPDQYNPDVVGRLRFAGATATSQLNALIATQGHQLKAGLGVGDVGAYGYGNGNQIGATAPTVAPTQIDPRTITPEQAKGLTPTGQPIVAAPTAATVQDVFPSINPIPPVNQQASVAGTNLTPTGALPGTEQPPAQAPVFSFRAQRPGETAQAYDSARKSAQKAFEKDPNNVRADSYASETGKLDSQNDVAATKAAELTDRLKKNLEAMLALNNDVPSTGFIPGSWKAAADQALAANGLSNGNTAKAANQWDQINNQQIISEIQQFVASGGANTRINQTLDRMIRAASGINRNDLPESRKAQIMNALAEIENKNVSAGNIAGGNAPYKDIPVQTSAPPGGVLYGTSGGKKVYKMPDNTFVMEQ